MKGIVDKVKYAIAFLPFLCPFFDSLEHDYLTIALCSMLLLFIAGRCFCSENGSLAISLSDVILGGFIIYIVCNSFLHNSFNSHFEFWQILLFVLSYWYGRSVDNSRCIVFPIFLCGMLQSIIILAQFSGLIESLSYYFPISGTFGNPAPSSILVAISLMICFSYKKMFGGRVVLFNLCASLLFVTLLIASRRTAIIGALCAIVFLLINKEKDYTHKVFIAIILLLTPVLLYFFAPSSCNVRLLIWRVSMQMWGENPVFGSGFSSFAAKYMFYQSSFFENNIGSWYETYANNHSQAYNEFIHLLCEQGLLGALIWLILVFVCFQGAPSVLKPVLFGMGIMTFFYNLYDNQILLLIFWLLLGYCGSYSRICHKLLHTRNRIALGVISVGLCGMCIALMCSSKYVEMNIRWMEVPTYEKSCEEGDKRFMMGDYIGAESYYKQAYYMIPCRIVALYKLFKLKEVTNPQEADEIADYILSEHRLLVDGDATMRIKNEIMKYKKK